jgi:hypothetical protein
MYKCIINIFEYYPLKIVGCETLNVLNDVTGRKVLGGFGPHRELLQ